MKFDTLVNFEDISADINSQIFFMPKLVRKKNICAKKRCQLIFDEKLPYKKITNIHLMLMETIQFIRGFINGNIHENVFLSYLLLIVVSYKTIALIGQFSILFSKKTIFSQNCF